jgi:hypothetical protein
MSYQIQENLEDLSPRNSTVSGVVNNNDDDDNNNNNNNNNNNKSSIAYINCGSWTGQMWKKATVQ